MKSSIEAKQFDLFPNNILDQNEKNEIRINNPQIYEWISAFENRNFKKTHTINNLEEIVNKEQDLKNEFQISHGPKITLDFSEISINENDPYQEIGYNQDIRKYHPIKPYYIFLTPKRHNGPSLVFTEKNVQQGIEVFYCNSIKLKNGKYLTGKFDGRAITSKNPEEFFKHFDNKST